MTKLKFNVAHQVPGRVRIKGPGGQRQSRIAAADRRDVRGDTGHRADHRQPGGRQRGDALRRPAA